MNLELSDSQQMMRESFARFLDEHSSMARVRAALPTGFDPVLWKGLADLGAFGMRVPDAAGGLDLGLLDATVLMEEVGRTLATGPIAEALIAARLLAVVDDEPDAERVQRAIAGDDVVVFAFHDLAEQPVQWVAGGAVATAVIARAGDEVVLITLPRGVGKLEPNLASTAMAELPLGDLQRATLAIGPRAVRAFEAAIEEWKLLTAAALSGLARESIRLAAAYAGERIAFGQPIGAYQAISHPLADLIVDVDGGKLLIWRAIRDIADGKPQCAAEISLALWWNATVAGTTVAQALQTFGGYGLTTEYDIHLYNLRAKAWPLMMGDPQRLLEQAGRRLYAGEVVATPDAGEVEIDFNHGADALAFADEVDAFFRRTLTPELKAKAHYSWDGHEPSVHKALAEARLLFPYWPEELGGRNASPYAVSAARQVWEKHGWGSHAANTTALIAQMIRAFGGDELKREVLAKIVSGDVICSLGFSEPGAGSDVFAAQCRATRQPDGSWRIDGQKMFTSGANIADYVLMLTRTNPDVAKHKGLTMFIVPLKTPGVEIQPVRTFQDESTNITYYDDVKVPDSYRLGDVDDGVKVMSAGLELEHGGNSGQVQAHMVRSAETLCHEINWRGRPLIEDAAAQMRLARVTADVLVTEALGWRALWAGAEKKPSPAYGPMSKLFASEKFLADSADLLDLTAPFSLSKRNGPAGFLNQCYRHAHGTRIYGGTSQVHRSIIAERNLGLPRSRAR